MKQELNFEAEKRKQSRLHKLGTNRPSCVVCGEEDYRCHERHHIAGRHFDDDTAILCRNCHRKLSDLQYDHPAPSCSKPPLEEIVAHFLLGLADLFELLIQKFRQFAESLRNNQSNAIAE